MSQPLYLDREDPSVKIIWVFSIRDDVQFWSLPRESMTEKAVWIREWNTVVLRPSVHIFGKFQSKRIQKNTENSKGKHFEWGLFHCDAWPNTRSYNIEVTKMENIMNDLRWKNVTRLFSADELDLGFSEREEWFRWPIIIITFAIFSTPIRPCPIMWPSTFPSGLF